MDPCEKLIREIDERVAYIKAQESLGASPEAVTAEQAKSLLATIAGRDKMEVKTSTKVAAHLKSFGVWDMTQLAAFSACIRANTVQRLNQPGQNRPMQTNVNLEHYLTEDDWEKLPTLQPPAIQECLAIRLHGYGMVCLDAASLKRASAIVQACMKQPTTADDKRQYAHDVKEGLKKLAKGVEWPFEYITKYPRSPFELPEVVLDHACGPGVRPVAPAGKFEGSSFRLLVTSTPYKKQRLHHTPAESALMPAPSQVPAASSGFWWRPIRRHGGGMHACRDVWANDAPTGAMPASYESDPRLEVWTVRSQTI